MKRNHSSDSPVSINGNVSIGGDGAIGKNAKIIKKDRKLSLLEILGIVVGIIAGIVGILTYLKNN